MADPGLELRVGVCVCGGGGEGGGGGVGGGGSPKKKSGLSGRQGGDVKYFGNTLRWDMFYYS